ncbi:hypothetical protein LCGC14_2134420 [marine sediment metagenome]|uniref:Uncharacterized protein n=1 Tax=marine sediment metagenome TaxID=412755 RepID=A0A0F9EML2_9ZZZZ
MPYPITATDTFTEINVGGRVGRINHTDLGAGGQAKLALVLKGLLQAEIDVRILRDDLPDDEPTKTVNPDAPNFFWGDSNGVIQNNPNRNNHLIARDTVVTEVVWDGTRYVVSQVRVP